MSDELLLKVCAVYSANIVSGPQSAMRAVIALIRAEVLEEAAKEANRGFTRMPADIDDWTKGYFAGCDESAAAIRALKEKST